jgi:hypothetical protein
VAAGPTPDLHRGRLYRKPYPPRRRFDVAKVSRHGARWLIAGCLAFAAGCGGPGSSPPAGTAPGKGPGTPAAAVDKPEVKTTAEGLAKEVLADEKAAGGKYKDKVVELEGAVEFANAVIGDGRMFHLAGAKKKPTDVVGLNLFCVPAAADKDKVWWLGKGQKVKVVGRVTGVTSSGVYLDQCTVTELEPSPTPRVTAEQLTGEFGKDEAAAKAKYLTKEGYPKEVIVEGTVAGLATTKDGFYSVNLAGKEGLAVSCTVNKEAYEGLKQGDKVTMKGDVSGLYKDRKAVLVNTAFVLKKG